MSVIAPGFQSTSDRDLYTGLFRVMCVTPVIFAASIALGEVLVADRRFLFYGLAPLLYNGGIVAGTVLFASPLGIFGAALGAVARRAAPPRHPGRRDPADARSGSVPGSPSGRPRSASSSG